MSDNFQIRSPSTEQEWKDYDAFRWEILRKPLKLSHIPLKDELEDESLHLMGIDNKNNIISCGCICLERCCLGRFEEKSILTHILTTGEECFSINIKEGSRREGLGSYCPIRPQGY